MQNKGFVKVFAVLLTLVCLFYLSFSFVTQHYNSKAAEYAGGDPAKESAYLDSLSTQKVWLGYTLKQCREMEISLGLDLKGGMNVVLELNVADVIRSLSNNNQDENFNKALDLAYAHQATSQKDFIDLFAEEYKKLDSGARLSAIFSTFELKDKITPQSSDAQVVSVLKQELQSAIDNSFNVLRTRIDRFGVVSPNIQRLETAGRILVELPGVKEPERVRKLLQGSANLEFWETYKLPEIYQQLVAADNVLATILSKETSADSVATDNVEKIADAADANVSEADSLLAELGQDKKDTEANQSMEEFAKQHPLFALLQISQYNGQLSPGSTVGIAQAKDMEKISEYLNMKQVKEVLPRNLALKWGVKAIDDKEQFFELYALKVTNRDGSPALGGDVVTDANADFMQQAGRSEQMVNMVMNAEGSKAWARLTKENIGRQIAIVLDEMVYSAPNVNDEITGGRSQITGHFTPEEAKDLANVLKSGKMAASVHIVQEDVVGPSLGQEAINAGALGFVGGGLFGLAYAPICLTGMHHSFIAIETQLIAAKATTGGSFIFTTASMNNVAQGAAVLAVLFLTKNEKMKSICSASGVSALLGITEPAMFGVTLKLKYPFYAAIIGSAVGNAYCAATGVLAQALGAAGLPGFLSMLPKDYLNFVIGLLLSMGVSAVLTAVFWKKFNIEGEDHKAETPVKEEVKEIEVQEPADTTEETNELYAPMKGEVLDVAKSADPAFASKAMGEGVAINPSEGIVYAPADGTISLIFPTKHAMGITLNSGVELLIHAGIDTVKMNGEGFETFVETGAKVKKGDKLLSFDMDLVKEKGYKTQTMFLVADAKGKEVEVVEAADADNNTKIMNLK